MTTLRNLQISLSQQAASLGLAVLVTSVLLAGLVSLAAPDQSALMARQAQSTPQAIASVLVAPTA